MSVETGFSGSAGVDASNSADPDDLYQEILFQIWRALPGLKETIMQTHDSISSRSRPQSALPASAWPAGGRSKPGKRTTCSTTTVLQNFAERSRNLTPWSRRSSLCWKTSPLRTFLPIFAIFAAALFFAEAAVGQATNRYIKVASQLVELINAGNYVGIQNNFNRQMDTALPLDKTSAFFSGLTQQMGRIEKLGEPRPVGGAMVFPATFEKGTLDLQIALDNRDLIAGFVCKPHVATKLELTERSAKVANRLVELINAGDYSGIQTNLNKEMDVALPLDKATLFFKGLAEQMGKIQKLGEPRPLGEAMVYPVTFEKGALDLQIALDHRGLIAGLLFRPQLATKAESDFSPAQGEIIGPPASPR